MSEHMFEPFKNVELLIFSNDCSGFEKKTVVS